MKIKTMYNKVIPYVKTYGFLKGIRFAKKQYKIHNNAKKDFNTFLPQLEKKLLDTLLKYKNIDYTLQFDDSQKNIFFFWWDGIEKAPDIIKTCYKRIKNFYNDFNIIEINKNNLNIAKLDDSIINLFSQNKISIQTFSDILRFKLISTYGGVWIDSTIFMVNKFDFLNDLYKCSFTSCIDKETANFYNYEGFTTSWSSFFIGGEKNHPVFLCVYNLYLNFLKDNKVDNINYFLTDCFMILCKKYGVGNDILNKYTKVNVDYPTSYISNNLPSKLDEKILNKLTIQKLNWRINYKKFNKNSYASFCNKGEL